MDLSVECADVVGHRGWELWERLQGTVGWEARFAACDEVLLGWLRDDATPPPEIDHAWRALLRSGGTVSVHDLARTTGWSRQHLRRRFTDELGLSPKLAARVVRFDRATALLRAASLTTTIADVAATCGYFDQSHLHRDFLALAGCTPSQFLAEEVPKFQAVTDDVA